MVTRTAVPAERMSGKEAQALEDMNPPERLDLNGG